MAKYIFLILTLLPFDLQTVVFYLGYNNTPAWNDMYFILERSREVFAFITIYLFLPDKNNWIREVFYLRLKDFILFNIIIACGRLFWVITRIQNDSYRGFLSRTNKVPDNAIYTQWVVNEKLSYFYLVIGIGIFTVFVIRRYVFNSKN